MVKISSLTLSFQGLTKHSLLEALQASRAPNPQHDIIFYHFIEWHTFFGNEKIIFDGIVGFLNTLPAEIIEFVTRYHILTCLLFILKELDQSAVKICVFVKILLCKEEVLRQWADAVLISEPL